MTDREARLLVGVAPQEVHLDRFLSAHELLAYHGRYFGMPKLEARRRADELLEVFDLTAKANTKPNRLSGGMRRRLLIARALVHRPRLLILDEPTAGVDLELRYELWHYLRRLHADEGLTILLTTHYIEEAEALCERVAFIKQGRIIDEGTPQELIALHFARKFNHHALIGPYCILAARNMRILVRRHCPKLAHAQSSQPRLRRPSQLVEHPCL